MRLLISLLLLALSSSYTFASPYDDDVLFGCFFNHQKVPKEVVVLRNGNDITYMYGKQNPDGEGGVIPEITIKKTASQLTKEWRNHSAISTELRTLNIPNGQYVYSVNYMSQEGKESGDVAVSKSGKYLTTLKCSDVWEMNLSNDALMKGIPDVE
jgi:ABC-type Fe3+-hydroxamate transport system substrate-binding protein